MIDRRITYGLACGSLVVAAYLAAYMTDPVIILKPALYWITSGVMVLSMLGAVSQERNQKGGLDFPGAVRIGFGVFIIANVMYYIFYYIIFKQDPSLEVLSKSLAIESLQTAQSVGGLEPGSSEYRELENQIKTQDYGVSFSTLLFAFARGAIFGFITAALIALFLKSPAVKKA